jgi:hypothetical protein
MVRSVSARMATPGFSGEDIRACGLARNTLNFQDFPNRLPPLSDHFE